MWSLVDLNECCCAVRVEGKILFYRPSSAVSCKIFSSATTIVPLEHCSHLISHILIADGSVSDIGSHTQADSRCCCCRNFFCAFSMPDKIKSSWPQHVATHTQCWLTGIFYWKTRHSKLAFDSFMFVTLPYSNERCTYTIWSYLFSVLFLFRLESDRMCIVQYIYIYIRYTMATTISSEWCECAKCVSSRSFDTKQQTTET